MFTLTKQSSYPPIYTEEAEQAAENLRLALPLISKHKSPINPVNYAVWYEYVSGENLALSNAIDALLIDNKIIGIEISQSLYEKHKLITYPRSDCRYLPMEHLKQAPQIIEMLKSSTSNISKAASNANNAAMIILSFQSAIGCNPNVTKKLPKMAVTANTKNFFDKGSLRITAAKVIANSGCNFCNNTTTDRFI